MTTQLRHWVIGKNSRIFKSLIDWDREHHLFAGAYSHKEIPSARFEPHDVGWIFSYSPSIQQNRSMFEALKAQGLQKLVLISSASVKVTEITKCYRYPTAKAWSEQYVRSHFNGSTIRLGAYCDSEHSLPDGVCVYTTLLLFQSKIIDVIHNGKQNFEINCFDIRGSVPPARSFEYYLYRSYARCILALKAVPCLLRPVDVLLRACGYRWYGYTFLGDYLWSTMKS